MQKKSKIAVFCRFGKKCPRERAQSTLNNLVAPSTERGLGWGKGERSPSRCRALSAIFSKKGVSESILGASWGVYEPFQLNAAGLLRLPVTDLTVGIHR